MSFCLQIIRYADDDRSNQVEIRELITLRRNEYVWREALVKKS